MNDKNTEESELFSQEELDALNPHLKLKKDRTFLLQPNIISRSINDVEATEKKLMALAMSYMPYKIDNDEDYTVSFSITEAIKALDLTDGQNQRLILESAVDKISGSQIKIALENGDWFKYTWFDKASWQPSTKTFTLTFNKTLGDALVQYKKAYSKIDLASLGRLSSKYSIRYFEIGLSYSGNKGINGNKKGTWFFEYSVDQLKQLFSIDKSQYKRTCDFTRRVVYDPIELLNKAQVGFSIEANPINKGKKLLGFRFICTETEPAPRKRIASANPIPDNSDYEEEIRQEEEHREQLKERYPDEYLALVKEVEQEKKQDPSKIMFSEYEALNRLEANHPGE
jgi:plasmid replication initiation protein